MYGAGVDKILKNTQNKVLGQIYSTDDSYEGENPSDIPNRKWTEGFGDYCVNQPRSYSYYDKVDIPWGTCEGYTIAKKIGRGKYSDVFLGWNLRDPQNHSQIVIKSLKSVRVEKLYREYKVLNAVKAGPNIVQLREFVRESEFTRPSYVFEYMPRGKMLVYRIEDKSLTDFDVRLYMYKIL